MSYGKILTHALLLGLMAFGGPAFAQSITIQGRVIDKNGNPVAGAGTLFRVKILTPTPERCVLFDETQSLDLSKSAGLFSINLNNGLGTRNEPKSYTLERALSNGLGFSVPLDYCQSGPDPVLYSPALTDNRKVVISFKDPGTMTAFEDIPEMDLNPVPYSLETRSLNGFTAGNLLRVVDGGLPASVASLTSANFTELQALLAGTSTSYMTSSGASPNGARLPTYAGNPSTPAVGSIWFDSTGSGALKFKDQGGTIRTLGVSGGSTVTSISVGPALTSNGPSGAVSIDLASLTPSPAGTYGSGSIVPGLEVDGYGRVTKVTLNPITGTLPGAGTDGQVLRSSSGAWGAGFVRTADIRSTSDQASIFPASNCSAGQTITWDSVNDKLVCTAISFGAVGPTANTYKIVNVDANGRVTGGSAPTTLNGLGILDGIAQDGNVPKISTGTDSPLPAGTLSGELLIATNSNKLYRYNGSVWNELSPATATGLADVLVAGGALTKSGSAATPTITLPAADASTNGFLSSAKFTEFTNKLSNALNSAYLFVGGTGGVATGVPASGDVALDNTGKFTVTGIRGVGVSAGSPTLGQILRYDGSNYAPNFLTMGDLRSTVTGASALTSGCTPSQTLTWNSATDSLMCSSIGGLNAATVFTAGTIVPAANLPASVTRWQDGASGAVYYNGGNVGIGTSAPQRMVHLQGTNAIWRVDRDQNTVGMQLHRFPAGDYTTPLKGFLIGVDASAANVGNFSISDYGQSVSGAATQRFLIDTNGRTGIGTTTPGTSVLAGYTTSYAGALLDVAGEVNGQGFRAVRNNAYNAAIDQTLLEYVTNQNARNTSVNTGWSIRAKSAAGSGANPVDLGFYPGSSSAYAANGNGSLDTLSASPTLFLSGAGNVGIGTSTPASKLHVAGTITADGFSGPFSSTGYTQSSGNFSQSGSGTFSTGTGAVSLNGDTTIAGGRNLTMASGTGQFSQTYSGTGTAATITGTNSGNLLSLNSASTTAVNGDKALNIALSGANATSAVTRYGVYSSVTSTGTNSTNVAGYFSASGGTNNYGLVVPNGFVGIGTSAPKAGLDLSGSLLFNGGLSNASTRPALAAGTLANGELRAYSASGAGADDGFLRVSAGGGNSVGGKTFIDLTGYSTVPDMAANIVFGTAGAERMRLSGTGALGIGTANPRGKLEVNGNIITSDAAAVPTNGANITGGYFDVGAKAIGTLTGYAYDALCVLNGMGNCQGAGGVVLGRVNTSATVNIPTTGATFFNGGRVGVGTTAPNATLQAGADYGNLAGKNALLGVSGPDPITYINSTDGTGSHYASLVFGNGGGDKAKIDAGVLGIGGMRFFADVDLTTPAMVINAGKVGIGTTAPTVPLAVRGDSNYGTMEIIANATNGESALGFRASNVAKDGVGNWILGPNLNGVAAPANSFSIYAGGLGNVMTMSSSGNVGISTNAPSNRLDVRGTTALGTPGGTGRFMFGSGMNTGESGAHFTYGAAATDTFAIQAESQNVAYRNMVLNPSGGNVGIGTTAAATRLQVNGPIHATDTGVGPDNQYGGAIRITRASGAAQHMNFVRSGSNVISLGYLPNTAKFGFGTGATNDSLFAPSYLTIDMTPGNVGIGSTSPAYKLDVNGSIRSTAGFVFPDGSVMTTAASASTGNSSTGDLNFAADTDADGNGALIMATGGNERIRVLSNGRIGIGTAAPAYTLDLINSSPFLRIGTPSFTSGGIYLGNNAHGIVRGYASGGGSNDLGVYTTNADVYLSTSGQNTTQFVLKNTSGNVGIGTGTPSEKLHVVGNLRVQGSTDCTLGAGSGGTNCTSDIRLKDDVSEIDQALAKLLTLRGVNFTWNEKSRSPGRQDIGVIAQDVEKVFPTAVMEDPSTHYKKVDYAVLVAPVIQAIKELHNELKGLFSSRDEHASAIAQLKAENSRLKAAAEQNARENAELRTRLDRIERSLASHR